MNLVIGLTGKIGSGKTTLANYLQKKYGFSKYQFSQILADILERLYLEKSRKNFQKLGVALRKEWGNVIVDALEKDIKKGQNKLIVIDGIRYENEMRMLRKFEKNILISLKAPVRLRYERCKKRGEKAEDKVTFKDFLKAEKNETEKKIEKISQLADYQIKNQGKKEELFKKIEKIIEKHKHEHPN